MFYRLIKPLILIALRIYFRRREVRGAEHEPRSGPFIVVANHPGTLMDPLVIGSSIKSILHFLSKATVFNPYTKWIFSWMGMIPVYRAHDDPKQIHKNRETFSRCYEHLEQGGRLLIFPEGVSFAARKLQKIKTGTARIALDTEARNDFKLGMHILCVGLNYSASHKFQSDVFVNIEPPIPVGKYKEQFLKEPSAAVNALTEEIRLKLERLTIALEDEEVDDLVRSIEKIYKAELLRELGFSSRDKEQDFLLTRKIGEAVSYFKEKDSEYVRSVKARIDRYFDLLERLNLNHELLSRNKRRRPRPFLKNLRSFFYFTLGFPVFLFGFINNYIPFRVPALITRAVAKDVEWFGGMNLALGMLVVIICYGLQSFLLHRYFPDLFTLPVTLAYLLSLPFSGIFAFYYWKHFTNLRGKWKLWALFTRKADLLSRIVLLREEILQEIREKRKVVDEIEQRLTSQ